MSIRNVTAVALFALAIAAASSLSAQDRTYHGGRSPADGDSVLPFSGAVQVGNTLYLSGMLGLDPGQQVPATAEAEARNVLNGMQGALEGAGMTMNDLVMVQIYSSDVSDYAAFNGVYRTYFTTEFPARAFIGAGTLLFGARFEVLGVAVKR
jgi:2-iminobutanoate/2-iminopropanoate deaminase